LSSQITSTVTIAPTVIEGAGPPSPKQNADRCQEEVATLSSLLAVYRQLGERDQAGVILQRLATMPDTVKCLSLFSMVRCLILIAKFSIVNL
jgi:hypothetical protein